MELIAYVVKKPDEPFNISRLRRDPASAWRLHLQTPEVDAGRFRQLVRQTSAMTGVKCCCFRVVASGYDSGDDI